MSLMLLGPSTLTLDRWAILIATHRSLSKTVTHAGLFSGTNQTLSLVHMKPSKCCWVVIHSLWTKSMKIMWRSTGPRSSCWPTMKYWTVTLFGPTVVSSTNGKGSAFGKTTSPSHTHLCGWVCGWANANASHIHLHLLHHLQSPAIFWERWSYERNKNWFKHTLPNLGEANFMQALRMSLTFQYIWSLAG